MCTITMMKSPLTFTLVIFALLGGTASHKVPLAGRPSCHEFKAAFFTASSCDDNMVEILYALPPSSSCDEARRELCDSKGCCAVDDDACQKRYHELVNQCALADLFDSKCVCEALTAGAAQISRDVREDDEDVDASGNIFIDLPRIFNLFSLPFQLISFMFSCLFGSC